TGLSACWRRYGDVACASRLGMPPSSRTPPRSGPCATGPAHERAEAAGDAPHARTARPHGAGGQGAGKAGRVRDEWAGLGGGEGRVRRERRRVLRRARASAVAGKRVAPPSPTRFWLRVTKGRVPCS